MWSLLFVCVFGCHISFSNSAQILAIFPTISKSHFLVFEPLLVELTKRGHNLTVISTFSQLNPVKNYTEINVSLFREVVINNFPIKDAVTFISSSSTVLRYLNGTQQVLYSPDVVTLASSNASFDLIFYEMFLDDVFLGFAHRYSAPAIAFGSGYMFSWVQDRFEISGNPAYVPSFGYAFNKNMNFLERIKNTFGGFSGRIFFKWFTEPKETEIVANFFGNTTPTVRSLLMNTSLYFTNTHFSYFGGWCYPPNVVDVSGIHLKSSKPLDQELDRWMNESSNGVIYFSFGSMLRGATLPMDKVKAFLQVFGSLSQRVLWKWEDDTVDNLPNNVKIMKWIPQRDVLAHPNVRVFISHGGLLGTTEAVVSGVPILGIPMYGDQPNNVAALVENGVAVHVDYNNISVASLSYALNVLLHDKRYRERAQELSFRFLDRPMSPLDTAVYWTEYVIRHRGAPHLQSAAVHLSWYQYYLLDVIAVVVSAVLLILSFTYYTIRSCLGFVCSSKPNKLKSN